jgi:hypothetical protein
MTAGDTGAHAADWARHVSRTGCSPPHAIEQVFDASMSQDERGPKA